VSDSLGTPPHGRRADLAFPEAQAATWSDTGKAVGADLTVLNAQPTRPVKRAPAPKPVAPKKSAPPQNSGSGI